jgi:hypothetical protein
MTIRRALPLVAGLTVAVGSTVVAVPVPVAAATEPGAAPSCEAVQDPPAALPAGLHEGDRLFLTAYRGFVVQLICGRIELVEPTGWDSCSFLHGDEVARYPC